MMTNAQEQADIIVVGRLVGVYGVKGWLKLMSFTRPITNILAYGSCLIQQAQQWQQFSLLEGKPHRKGLVVAFEGVLDRDQARLLVGSEIAINKKQLPVATAGEFYWHDLLNAQVINVDNELLGVVTDILETAVNDVLVVVDDQQRRFIPYVLGVYIKDVDIIQGFVRVDWQSDY